MATVTAFGMNFDIDTERMEEGNAILNMLHERKTAPIDCIAQLVFELRLTSREAMGLYTAWLKENKPVF